MHKMWSNLSYIVTGAGRIIEAFFKKLLTPRYIKEQVMVRTIMAKPCVLKGKCLSCGCSFRGVFDKRYSSVACDKFYENLPDYCYQEFMNKKEWEEHKKLLQWDWFLEEYLRIEKEAKDLRSQKSWVENAREYFK